MISNIIRPSNIIVFTIALFVIFPSVAQVNSKLFNNKEEAGYDKKFEEKLVAKVFINPIPANNIQYFKAWTNGEVYLSTGNAVKNEMLRYNCFLDELLWIRTLDYQIGIVYKSTVSEFVLYDKETNKKLVFRNMRMKNWLLNDSSNIYLQVLVEGDISLYAQRKAKKISSFNDLVRKDEYYLLYHGTYFKFKPNRYNLYRLMSEIDKPKMKTAVRSEHLKVRFESQLVRAIEIYNANEKVILK